MKIPLDENTYPDDRAYEIALKATMNTTPESKLSGQFGHKNWSVRLMAKNTWSLYIWHPFTNYDDDHGTWSAERTTTAKSHHQAIERFAAQLGPSHDPT